MLVIGSSNSIVEDVKLQLSANFEMKDLGVVDTILGMKVRILDKCITLDQSHYIRNLLSEWGYGDCKEIETPFDAYVKLEPNTGSPVKPLEYSKLIGSLMYAMCCTRPDISFSVGMLSRFTSNPNKEHWKALDRLMGYLKKTSDYALTYTGQPQTLEGFSDASWCSEVGDSRSTSGYVFLLGGAAVVWKSKRQTMTALSSMEAELFALASGGEEAEWIKDLLTDLSLKKMKINSVTVYCDNQATKTVASNTLFNGKRRTVRLKQAYLNFLIEYGIITLIDVRSHENLADTFTKGLKKEQILRTANQMGLRMVLDNPKQNGEKN